MTKEERLSVVGSLVVDMLKELSPEDPVWAIVGRRFTAGEMITLIEQGTAEGDQYVIDSFRVARDIIAHSAKKARLQ